MSRAQINPGYEINNNAACRVQTDMGGANAPTPVEKGAKGTVEFVTKDL